MDYRYNILCVDDSRVSLRILESILSKEKEYRIIRATSGSEALEMLIKLRVDIILLDIAMPELDGYEVAEIIKRNKHTSDIPILFVTAGNDPEGIAKGFKVGGADYIIKPYSELELKARIKNQLLIKDAHDKIKIEKDLVQNIIDMQDNIIITTDKEEIKRANASFLKFFDVESLEDFKKKHKCICELFLREEDFYSLDDLKEDEDWIEKIVQNPQHNFIVLMDDKADLEPKAFAVKANRLGDDTKYVVTFTDITEISKKTKKFEKIASYDMLTGIFNRNKLNEFLSYEISISNRYSFPLSLIMIDIDYFKNINDTHGHIAGDKVLKTFCNVVKAKIRNTDIFARWGGEEFIIVCPNTKLENALIIAENLRKLVKNTTFEGVKGITCSFGVAEFKQYETLDSLIKRADNALYTAKANGRDRVVKA